MKTYNSLPDLLRGSGAPRLAKALERRIRSAKPKRYTVRELLARAIASAIQNEEALVDAYSNCPEDDPTAKDVREDIANFTRQLRAYRKRRAL